MHLLLVVVLAASQTTAYEGIYSTAELERADRTFHDNLVGVWEGDLLGRLSPAHRRAATTVGLRLPLTGAGRNPFDFYASPTARAVTIPVLSVKFLDDLAIATTWYEVHGCSMEAVSDYVGILRYRGTAAFGGTPAPLNALGITRDRALADTLVDDASQKSLKSAVYFLMAHELGHVIFQHPPYDVVSARHAQQQEMEADAFALNLMRRITVAPVGIVMYFVMASRWESAPGDFGSYEEFERYVQHQATHPLTSERITTIGRYIRANAGDFARGQLNSSQWVDKIHALGRQIEQLGADLDDAQLREYQRYRSLTQDPTGLRLFCH